MPVAAREQVCGTSNIDFIRFIPNREGQDLQASFSLLHDDGSPATPSKQKKRTPHGELHFQKSKRSAFKPLPWLTIYQLKKQIGRSQHYFDPKSSIPPSRNLHLQISPQIKLYYPPHIQRPYTTRHDHIHLLLIQVIRHYRPP
jgi:hypothetical protein